LCTKGSSLEQAHIFALCHIFRRPIIVYSVKYVKSLTGENLGVTHFAGVYLPLTWEPAFCSKNPLALGYTRGHFTALVPLERARVLTYGATSTIGTRDG
jgi:ubiquitin thioesterase ZRANB1